jgi:hypothetical protein
MVSSMASRFFHMKFVHVYVEFDLTKMSHNVEGDFLKQISISIVDVSVSRVFLLRFFVRIIVVVTGPR